MDLTSVWLISRGDYSDYEVVAVAPDKAAAERLAAALNDHAGKRTYDTYEVDSENVPYVDSDTPLDVADVLTIYGHLQHDEDGITEWKSPEERHTSGIAATIRPPRCLFRMQPTVKSEGYPLRQGFSVQGTDHERVRKVFSERRARYLASIAEWHIVDRKTPLTAIEENA